MTPLDEAVGTHIDAVRATVDRNGDVIRELVAAIVDSYRHGGKLLICGNGGSAADAQHLAAEFMNRMHVERDPLPAIALSTDTSVMTSIANDSAYELVFARQVRALGRPEDVLIGMSTSGNSASVLAALAAGRVAGLTTVGFTGEAGSTRMVGSCDLLIVAQSRETPRIQECHEFVYHFVASTVEAVLVRG